MLEVLFGHLLIVNQFNSPSFLTFLSVGVCVLADAHLEDKSHAPFSPDDVNVGVVAECRGLASPVTSTALESLEENKIVLEEQSTREEVGLVEKVKGTATPTRFILISN